MLIEVELNLFVGDVYAQLFKGIPFEIFKAKYVEDSNSVIIISAKQNKGKQVVICHWNSTQKNVRLVSIFGHNMKRFSNGILIDN